MFHFFVGLFLGSLKPNRNYTLFILCLDPEENKTIGSATLIITILNKQYNIENDTVFIQFTGRLGVFIKADITKYKSERKIDFSVQKLFYNFCSTIETVTVFLNFFV